jgi:DNA helicase-2/ATP-dependent DNA helicase PcrA
MLRNDSTRESQERLQNLDELLKGMEEHAATGATLQHYLEQVALVTDLDSYDSNAERITLMTLHAAKGLEFPVVFMTGMEEGLFPHSRSTDTDEEEERRLCYVGMTRAMKKLYLTHTRCRRVYGSFQENARSRFLSEIPAELCQWVDLTVPPVPAMVYRGRPRSRFTWDDGVSDRLDRATSPAVDFEDDGVRVVYDDENGFRVGHKVRHAKFGFGVVQGVEGHGEGRKVTVLFRSAGRKKLVLRYANLQPA